MLHSNISGNVQIVRDIVVIDHSNEQPIIISIWVDLAEAALTTLHVLAEKFELIGFTALKVYTHKGFSLSASLSTNIIEEPTGERAVTLGEWFARHQDNLADVQARAIAARDTTQLGAMTTIAELKHKRAHNTLPEERLCLNATIHEADLERVYAYFGCSYCNTRCDTPDGRTYLCRICLKKESVSSPRVSFNCQVYDGTGTLHHSIHWALRQAIESHR